MPIILNEETFSNGGTVTLNLGDGDVNVTEIYASVDGSDPVQVWIRAITCTDLVRWYNWGSGGVTHGVNSWGEGGASYANGIQLLSGAPSAGVGNGFVQQNVSMVNGHKYWLYFGIYAGDGISVATPFGSYSYRNTTTTVSTVMTYTGTTGNILVSASNTSSDVTSSDYCRLCSMNIVDLTASFGAGNEPTAQWCATNLGIFNGSKTVTP